MTTAGVASRWTVSVLVSLALALVAASPALAAVGPPTESATADPIDTLGPLDLTEVTLAQHDVRMSLSITTTGRWDSAQLDATADRKLCVTLVWGEPPLAGARICVARNAGRPALDLAPLAADGTTGVWRRLVADVARPAPNVLEATFLPAAAGLSIGRYTWYGDSAWHDETSCPNVCHDRAPDTGAVDATIALLAVPPCFGAAARDRAQPCRNPALRDSVEPTPDRAKVDAVPFCDTVERAGLVNACGFGTPAQDAAHTFALIGDSHAAHMKAALTVLTLAKRWRGVSMLRSGCPPTLATPLLATAQRARECRAWNRQAIAWLAMHPEVDTVFLSAHSGARVAPVAGRSPVAATIAGYRRELRELLRLGRRPVIIRDTPPSTLAALDCVSRALLAGRRAQTRCTTPRARSVRLDPLVAAARAERSPLVKVIDLTDQFCDARRCFAVIGGVLVRHDASHLTRVFAATLGPFVLRALEG
jgi:hypothetical protein